jgi:hypothetical protein
MNFKLIASIVTAATVLTTIAPVNANLQYSSSVNIAETQHNDRSTVSSNSNCESGLKITTARDNSSKQQSCQYIYNLDRQDPLDSNTVIYTADNRSFFNYIQSDLSLTLDLVTACLILACGCYFIPSTCGQPKLKLC